MRTEYLLHLRYHKVELLRKLYRIRFHHTPIPFADLWNLHIVKSAVRRAVGTPSDISQMKFPSITRLLLGGLALASATLVIGSPPPPPLALKTITASQIVAPVGIANAGDGSKRLFVCDQVGKIWVITDEMQLPAPFLDISASGTNELITLRSGYDERGLLSMAFHPGFANPASPGYGKFYVFYSAPSPNAPGTATNPVCCRSTVSEFQVSATNPNVADTTKERLVISWDKPGDSVNYYNHNGGQLAFGPEAGPNGERYLYITVGDGAGIRVLLRV